MTKAERVRQILRARPDAKNLEIAREINCSPQYVQNIKTWVRRGYVRLPEGATPNEEKIKTVVSDWFLDLHGNPTRLIEGVVA